MASSVLINRHINSFIPDGRWTVGHVWVLSGEMSPAGRDKSPVCMDWLMRADVGQHGGRERPCGFMGAVWVMGGQTAPRHEAHHLMGCLAEGVSPMRVASSSPVRSRTASFRTTRHGHGSCLLGQRYYPCRKLSFCFIPPSF